MHHKPLIITLDIDETHRHFFNALRQAHFPNHANYLDAHLTLFYHLPSGEPAIYDILRSMVQRPPLVLTVDGIVNFANGVAYTIQSDDLQQWHAAMQTAFDPWLKRQDRQVLRPHITIQNKVTSFKAQQLHTQLKETFVPFTITGIGIRTWLYLRGPWKEIHLTNGVPDFRFRL
ncbi:2'-5' RNA ligase family protein [Chitinophaga nivalis]|uniref:2'-5' RNA ligase family protein n=1 Tax=Chitinophaga nivalis TaxID=2991709 RepID=A0ABT3II39_9BACT|nr:2'-5' RNA ligase family protein [Chitinophaga nivalis]MCW3466718.1 2'-5' RNA ligase family protein [Chitinophaga nivalis]MCW3483591.1 2'-5' RNA ligase family protein [Chitinophaga nivalis]